MTEENAQQAPAEQEKPAAETTQESVEEQKPVESENKQQADAQ